MSTIATQSKNEFLNYRQAMTQKNNFDGLRLVGALLVLLSHQFAVSGQWEPRFVGDHSFGNLGVLIFFSISGYLVSKSWDQDPNPMRFTTRRFLRIFPGLATSIAITFFFVYFFNLSGFPGNPRASLNSSLWTIPIEIACYLVLMALGLVFRTAEISILLSTSISFLLTDQQYGTIFFLSYFGMFFSWGAMLYRFTILRSAIAGIAFWSLGLALIAEEQTILGLSLIVPFSTIFIGTRDWPVVRNIGKFGDFSYGIYIYAWPVQQTFVHVLSPSAGYFILLAPSLITTLALSFVSWHVVERRALAFKPTIPTTCCNKSMDSSQQT